MVMMTTAKVRHTDLSVTNSKTFPDTVVLKGSILRFNDQNATSKDSKSNPKSMAINEHHTYRCCDLLVVDDGQKA